MKRDEERARNDASFRLDILGAAEEIKTYTSNLTHAAYLKDKRTQRAVERVLGMIGEAAAQFSEASRRQYPEVPWTEIVGLRQHLLHAYWTIDQEVLWNTIKKDIPDLARHLRQHELKKPSAQLEAEIAQMLGQGVPKAKRKRR